MQTDFPQTPDPAESLVRFCEEKSAAEDASAIERLLWEQLSRMIARLAAAIADFRAAPALPKDNAPEPEPRCEAPAAPAFSRRPARPRLLSRALGWLRRSLPFGGRTQEFPSAPETGDAGGAMPADPRMSPCGDPAACPSSCGDPAAPMPICGDLSQPAPEQDAFAGALAASSITLSERVVQASDEPIAGPSAAFPDAGDPRRGASASPDAPPDCAAAVLPARSPLPLPAAPPLRVVSLRIPGSSPGMTVAPGGHTRLAPPRPARSSPLRPLAGGRAEIFFRPQRAGGLASIPFRNSNQSRRTG